jgi:hypothetical protein
VGGRGRSPAHHVPHAYVIMNFYRSLKVAVQGLDLMAHHLYIHTYNQEFYSVFKMIESRGIRCAGHVVRIVAWVKCKAILVTGCEIP